MSAATAELEQLEQLHVGLGHASTDVERVHAGRDALQLVAGTPRPPCEARRPCTCCPEQVHRCDDPAVELVSWEWPTQRGRCVYVGVFCTEHAELIARTAAPDVHRWPL